MCKCFEFSNGLNISTNQSQSGHGNNSKDVLHDIPRRFRFGASQSDGSV